MLRDLVLKNRSYRRFYHEIPVPIDTLKEFVDLARLTASSGNKQPLKYLLSSDSTTNALIFSHLSWAGYLENWSGPSEEERPAAYVVVLGDNEIADSFAYDCGIAVQTILLASTEKGLGGCIVASIRREELRSSLNIPSRYEILLVVAVGKPKELVVLESIRDRDDIRYWRDDQSVHHVPKRPLQDVILQLYP